MEINMGRVEKARQLADQSPIVYGKKPAFLVLTGSDAFGFPSKDSDYDVRGVYVANTRDVLTRRLAPRSENPTRPILDINGDFDLHLTEIEDFMAHIAGSKGNFYEMVLGDPDLLLSIDESRLYNSLRTIARASLNEGLVNHYTRFSEGQKREGEKSGTIKNWLYAIRAALTGAYLLEEEKLVSNINVLNRIYGLKSVPALVELKSEAEQVHVPKKLITQTALDWANAMDILKSAQQKRSTLPERVDRKDLEEFLINIRNSN